MNHIEGIHADDLKPESVILKRTVYEEMINRINLLTDALKKVTEDGTHAFVRLEFFDRPPCGPFGKIRYQLLSKEDLVKLCRKEAFPLK
jgi:hypothetical protein